MSMTLRYSGMLVARDGTLWRADVLAEGNWGSVGTLTFPGDRPLVIEWPERGKEEVVCGSTATLTVESPGDRTYQDLYTVQAGSVCLRVWWRDADECWHLWWTGTLDPEFYEEPYDRGRCYDVRLTFQDFGILSRLCFSGRGVVSLRSVLEDALWRSGLGGVEVSTLVSTQWQTGGGAVALLLEDIGVQGENFYDETGDSMTLKEVVEGVFQPLGLKLQQRGGVIWVYDLNALWERGDRREVMWSGTGQRLGVDRVVHRVKVTWSPYARTSGLLEESCWVKACDELATNLNSLTYASPDWEDAIASMSDGEAKELMKKSDLVGWQTSSRYLSYDVSQASSDRDDATAPGFTLWLSPTGKGGTLGDRSKWFKTVRQLDGEDCEGIALLWPAVRYVKGSAGEVVVMHGVRVFGDAESLWERADMSGHPLLWCSPRVWFPGAVGGSGLELRLSVRLLLDVRVNPYEEAAGLMESHEAAWRKYLSFVYVPVVVKYETSGVTYYWDNSGALGTGVYAVRSMSETLGEWRTSRTVSYLAWYGGGDRSGETGVGGWQTNKQAIGCHGLSLNRELQSSTDGQYLPWPPTANGGYLSVEILGGWRAEWLQGGGAYGGVVNVRDSTVLMHTLWALLCMPQLDVVRSTYLRRDLPESDVSYSGLVNADAKESVEIETVCGTARGDYPLARGMYVSSGSWSRPVEGFERGGMSGSLEELLIGTLCSQWARRHVKLTGPTELDRGGLCVLMEAHQPGLVLMRTGEVADVAECESDVTLVELSPDEWKVES